MFNFLISSIIILVFGTLKTYGNSNVDLLLNKEINSKNVFYKYNDKPHTFLENSKNLGIVYGMTWFLYPIVQPKVFHGVGGWNIYKKNFGKLVFDQDEPFWNSFVHPLSGSQLYLFYRGNGYDKITAFQMTFLSSALFEFTVEIFTEPASVQDLFQTPVLGTVLGFGIENLSLYLINSDNSFGKAIGHLINPATLFPFFEGKIYILPKDTNFEGVVMGLQSNF